MLSLIVQVAICVLGFFYAVLRIRKRSVVLEIYGLMLDKMLFGQGELLQHRDVELNLRLAAEFIAKKKGFKTESFFMSKLRF